MNSIFSKIELVLSIPKSLYVSFKLLPFRQSLHLPIIVRFNTKVIECKGHAVLRGGGRLIIGFGHVSEFDNKYERSIIKFNGMLTVETPCRFGQGCRIIQESNGRLSIGKGFVNTANLTISNRGIITIGNDCLVSWKTWICDTDFHKVVSLDKGITINPNGETRIGNKVWIGANSSVMKGSVIPNGCIVGSCSLVNKPFTEDNCLLAGIPAFVKKNQVTWNI